MEQATILARHYEQAMSEVLPGRSSVVDIAISLIKERAADIAKADTSIEVIPKLKVNFFKHDMDGEELWEAILYHDGKIQGGMSLGKSRHKDNIRYIADNARYIIGEIDQEPKSKDYHLVNSYTPEKDDSRNKISVWFGPMPESNGRTNWTVILYKGGELTSGITIDRSEYKDRVRYRADRVRYIIGELAEEPDILEYDGNLHSGYGRNNKVEFTPVEPSDGGNCD